MEMDKEAKEAIGGEELEAKAPEKSPAKKSSVADHIFSEDDSKALEERRLSQKREIVKQDHKETVYDDDDDDDDDDNEEEDDRLDEQEEIHVSKYDLEQAKMLLMFYDRQTANMFSVYAFGTWDEAHEFHIMGNLFDAKEAVAQEEMIRAGAMVCAKHRFRFGPEVVLAAGLSANLGAKFIKAKKIKQDLARGGAAPQDIAPAKQSKKKSKPASTIM